MKSSRYRDASLKSHLIAVQNLSSTLYDKQRPLSVN